MSLFVLPSECPTTTINSHLLVFRAVGIFRPRSIEQGQGSLEHSGCRRRPSTIAEPRSLSK